MGKPSTLSLLEADSINLSFSGRMILNNIYLSCKKGEVIGIVGRNGSGKSSLMKVIFGTLRADNQSVRVNGSYFSHPYRQQRRIRYLPQDGFLPGYLNVPEITRLFNLERHRAEFEDFDEIKGQLNGRLADMSGGQRKLLEVLTILYCQADFILLDEPFSYLAPVTSDKLQGHIERQRANKGIILTDHRMNTVLDVCDRLYLVRTGVLQEIRDRNVLVDLGYITAG